MPNDARREGSPYHDHDEELQPIIEKVRNFCCAGPSCDVALRRKWSVFKMADGHGGCDPRTVHYQEIVTRHELMLMVYELDCIRIQYKLELKEGKGDGEVASLKRQLREAFDAIGRVRQRAERAEVALREATGQAE